MNDYEYTNIKCGILNEDENDLLNNEHNLSSGIMLNFLFLFLTGMAVYNVFIVCTIGVPLAIYSDKQAYEFSFYVITISIFFCTTLTLCLVFVPKVCIKYLFGFLCLFWMLLYQGLLIHIVRITRSIYQHYNRIYSTRHG